MCLQKQDVTVPLLLDSKYSYAVVTSLLSLLFDKLRSFKPGATMSVFQPLDNLVGMSVSELSPTSIHLEGFALEQNSRFQLPLP